MNPIASISISAVLVVSTLIGFFAPEHFKSFDTTDVAITSANIPNEGKKLNPPGHNPEIDALKKIILTKLATQISNSVEYQELEKHINRSYQLLEQERDSFLKEKQTFDKERQVFEKEKLLLLQEKKELYDDRIELDEKIAKFNKTLIENEMIKTHVAGDFLGKIFLFISDFLTNPIVLVVQSLLDAAAFFVVIAGYVYYKKHGLAPPFLQPYLLLLVPPPVVETVKSPPVPPTPVLPTPAPAPPKVSEEKQSEEPSKKKDAKEMFAKALQEQVKAKGKMLISDDVSDMDDLQQIRKLYTQLKRDYEELEKEHANLQKDFLELAETSRILEALNNGTLNSFEDQNCTDCPPNSTNITTAIFNNSNSLDEFGVPPPLPQEEDDPTTFAPPLPPGSDGEDFLAPPPPPGAEGALPPPPPPGMAIKKGPQPTKPVIKPSVPMKSLFWSRIILPPREERQPNQRESVWDSVNNVPIQLNFQEIEEQFSKKETSKTNVKEEETEIVKSVLEPIKHKAIAVMLPKLPETNEDFISAIDSEDLERLPPEVVKILKKNLASPEELRALKSVPTSTLDKPDKLLLSLSEISNLDAYLACWTFKLEFRELLRDFRTPVDNLETGIGQVKNCDRLRKILAFVLSIGNYMNGGTNRGQADGFDLTVLEQLNAVKGLQNRTLLDYIVILFCNQSGLDAISIMVEELNGCENASRVSLDDLRKDLSSLQTRFNETKKCLNAILENKDTRFDAFKKRYSTWFQSIEQEIKMSQYRFNDVVKNFKNLLLFFNVPEREVDITTPSQFFTLIHKFTTNCSNSLKALKEQEEKSKKSTTIKINKKSVNYGHPPNSNEPSDNQSPKTIVKQVSTDLRSKDIRKNITIGGEFSKGFIADLGKQISPQSPQSPNNSPPNTASTNGSQSPSPSQTQQTSTNPTQTQQPSTNPIQTQQSSASSTNPTQTQQPSDSKESQTQQSSTNGSQTDSKESPSQSQTQQPSTTSIQTDSKESQTQPSTTSIQTDSKESQTQPSITIPNGSQASQQEKEEN